MERSCESCEWGLKWSARGDLMCMNRNALQYRNAVDGDCGCEEWEKSLRRQMESRK